MNTDKTTDLLNFMRGYVRNNPSNRGLVEEAERCNVAFYAERLFSLSS